MVFAVEVTFLIDELLSLVDILSEASVFNVMLGALIPELSHVEIGLGNISFINDNRLYQPHLFIFNL